MIKSIEDEMVWTCSMHDTEEECIWDFGGKTRRKDTTRET
jgi:hypothetical protein